MHGHKWFLKMGELSDASITASMSEATELIHCDYSFNQGIDNKGQAQTSVRVSDITLTYDGLPSREALDWALSSANYLNGAIILYDANDMPVTKLFFQDAACISLNLNYTCYGKSPILTQVKINPCKVIIDDITLDQRWKNISGSSLPPGAYKTNLTNKVFSIAQPIGKYTVDLRMEGKTYEIENFNISFEQGVDHKGQPQNEVRSGIINFSIASLPTNELNRWMLRSDMLKDGEFVFNQGAQSSPLKIAFSEAYCISMATRTSSGRSMITDIAISANDVSMNEKFCYNHFKL